MKLFYDLINDTFGLIGGDEIHITLRTVIIVLIFTFAGLPLKSEIPSGRVFSKVIIKHHKSLGQLIFLRKKRDNNMKYDMEETKIWVF